MARALKVFRTAAGFDDAYVAAPSRAAALRAWGADRDLFARGVAEEVTDPALAAEPLARPGEVIRRSRGTAAEQLASLPPTRPKRAAPSRKKAATPDRGALDAAEAELTRAEAAARRAARDFDERAAALARERRAAERDAAGAVRAAKQARDAARRAYDEARG